MKFSRKKAELGAVAFSLILLIAAIYFNLGFQNSRGFFYIIGLAVLAPFGQGIYFVCIISFIYFTICRFRFELRHKILASSVAGLTLISICIFLDSTSIHGHFAVQGGMLGLVLSRLVLTRLLDPGIVNFVFFILSIASLTSLFLIVLFNLWKNGEKIISIREKIIKSDSRKPPIFSASNLSTLSNAVIDPSVWHPPSKAESGLQSIASTSESLTEEKPVVSPNRPEDIVEQPEKIPEIQHMPLPEKEAVSPHLSKTTEFTLPESRRLYSLPPVELLDEPQFDNNDLVENEVNEKAHQLIQTLKQFNIESSLERIVIGPVLTRFEIKTVAGIKVSKVTGLSDDIALSLAVSRVRILAPIPGKSLIGIEIPNKNKSVVRIREMIASSAFQETRFLLPFILGKGIEGKKIIVDIRKMPHLIIAGATGSGKSVCVNILIMSILYHCHPQEVKLIMVDPKVVELKPYDDIPHLLFPVITNMKEVKTILNWLVQEMDDRYRQISELKVRNLEEYNEKVEEINKKVLPQDEQPKLPYILLIIDEFADLMAISSNDVESTIMRLAQKARAIGIHLILATQRPSVDVITGVIKANFPERIAFQTTSKTDSRTILDVNGAEKLIGRGDMLYMSGSSPIVMRIQGAYIDIKEIEKVVEFVKKQAEPEYIEIDDFYIETDFSDDNEPLYGEALEIIRNSKTASTSMLQRHLKIGYNRAARIIDKMEGEGIISAPDGSKPRRVLI